MVPHQHHPFSSIYHYIKQYISQLCILNIVYDFCAMFINMWVSISFFNYEHHYWSKVLLAVVVKVKICMCCVQFLGSSSFSRMTSFLRYSSFLWSSLFLGSSFFGLSSIIGSLSFLGQNKIKEGQMGSNRANRAIRWPNGDKRGQTGQIVAKQK